MNGTLEHLDLGVNSLGDEGAGPLARMLYTNCSLRTLALWGNSLDAPTVKAFATALSGRWERQGTCSPACMCLAAVCRYFRTVSKRNALRLP